VFWYKYSYLRFSFQFRNLLSWCFYKMQKLKVAIKFLSWQTFKVSRRVASMHLVWNIHRMPLITHEIIFSLRIFRKSNSKYFFSISSWLIVIFCWALITCTNQSTFKVIRWQPRPLNLFQKSFSHSSWPPSIHTQHVWMSFFWKNVP